jgi:hypothetical protein
VLRGFRIVAGATVQLAEAAVAVGDERTHPKLIGAGESLAVVRVGGRQVKRVGLRGDLTEEAEATRPDAPCVWPSHEALKRSSPASGAVDGGGARPPEPGT